MGKRDDTLHLRLDSALKEAIEAGADRLDISTAGFVRMALREYLQRHGPKITAATVSETPSPYRVAESLAAAACAFEAAHPPPDSPAPPPSAGTAPAPALKNTQADSPRTKTLRNTNDGPERLSPAVGSAFLRTSRLT